MEAGASTVFDKLVTPTDHSRLSHSRGPTIADDLKNHCEG